MHFDQSCERCELVVSGRKPALHLGQVRHQSAQGLCECRVARASTCALQDESALHLGVRLSIELIHHLIFDISVITASKN